MKRKLSCLFLLWLSILYGPNAGALTMVYPTKGPPPQRGLSPSMVVEGLKEALSLGARTAAGLASRVDGFYANPLIFIPFPPEAKMMKNTLEALGFRRQVAEFIMVLNRAAEEAAKRAAPIFLYAIRELTIQDGYQILRGPNDAATQYLRSKTTGKLIQAFRPVVRQAINKVELAKYWAPLVTRYNMVPFVKKVNPNLDSYVTERAVSGLFKLIANEEKKIRQNPSARVTDILRRVFGAFH